MEIEQPIDTKAEAERTGIRTTTLLAWSIWLLSALFGVLYVFLASVNHQDMIAAGNVPPWFLPSVLMFPTVGALVASRQPHNPIGWLLLAGGLALFGAFANQYGIYAVSTSPGSLPGGIEMIWVGSCLTSTGILLLLTFAVLLFPSGHLPSARWKPVAWLAGVFIFIFNVGLALNPGPMIQGLPASRNPYGIDQAAGVIELFNNKLANPIFVALIVASTVSLIERFRHAGVAERQQLKWIAYASVFLMVVFAGLGLMEWLWDIRRDPAFRDTTYFALAIAAVALAGFPIAVGIAILRHHLFNIDLIINRTLVYVPLTGILAGIYSASITLFQKLFVAVTGEKSDAAIVLTTLILASTFTPIKNWLQAFVDRRFKEAPDPARRLKAFADEVQGGYSLLDPRKLARCLLEEAMQAFDARSGALYKDRDGRLEIAHTVGEWKDGDAEMSVPLELDGGQLYVIRLGPRKQGHEYTEKDSQTLRQVVDVVAEAIAPADQSRV